MDINKIFCYIIGSCWAISILFMCLTHFGILSPIYNVTTIELVFVGSTAVLLTLLNGIKIERIEKEIKKGKL